MSRIPFLPAALALCPALAALPAAAQEGGETFFPKISFLSFYEAGRIENAVFDNDSPMKSVWQHRSGAWINFTARKGDRLSLDLLAGGTYYTATKEQSDVNSKQRFFAASVPRFDVGYVFGDPESPLFRLDAGIFHFKYNENSRNLGEYMFRTGTYPGWIYTGGINLVGSSNAQLSGLRLSQSLGNFSHDLIATLETEVLPTYDLSLTYMARMALGESFKVGGGVQLARILPARPSKTNPTLIRDATFGRPAPYHSNRYFQHNGQWYVDWPDFYKKQREYADTLVGRSVTAADSQLHMAESARFTEMLKVLDSARGKDDLGGGWLDTVTKAPLIRVSYEHFNATGIKPMAWFSFDPKPFLGGSSLFSPADLILYGEAAILGVQDYPVLYDDITKRIPVMIGFNVPTFKLLDVLAVEAEYYGSVFPDNYAQLMNNDAAPRPTVELSGGYSPEAWKKDDVKWSVYGQRRLAEGITLSGQVARDHARAWAYPTGKTYWGIIREKDHWHWMFKLTAAI